MIETGLGPSFAFCETGIKCTFTGYSIEAECLDGSAPLHCCVVRSRCRCGFVSLLGYRGEHASHRAQRDGNGVRCYSSISGISFPKLLKSRLATACSALSSLLSAISLGGGPSASISALIRSGMELLGLGT